MKREDITVLIVDDHMLMRSTIEKFFFSMGVTNITFANDGMDALTKIESKVFDIISTDLYMPVLSGEDFLKKVRGDSRYDQSALLIVSSDGDKATMLRLISQGATSFLAKPFSTEQFQDTVTRLLSWLENKRNT